MDGVKRLYRPKANRVCLGVCAGLGEYFGVDPVLVRVIFVLATLAGGPGLLAYIILAVIMPEEEKEKAKRGEPL